MPADPHSLDWIKWIGAIVGLGTLVGFVVIPFRLYFDVQAMKAEMMHTEAQIENALAAGRVSRGELDARIREQERDNAALAATMQGMGAKLTDIGAALRDIRQSIEDRRP